jgi:lipopolysaccharide export system permease protein
MIFRRALQRELASVAGATFTVLFSILVTWTLITILGRAAGGKVNSGDALALIGLAVVNYQPTILILTSFISVLVVITRSYRDSEMVVWFASGQSLARWIAPVFTFGLPIVAVVAALSFVVIPWAQLKSSEFSQRFEKREDLQRVAPGQFRESAGANRVFFVESTGGRTSPVVQNVFVNTVEKGLTTTVVAKEGVIEPDGKGGQYLVLKNGRRYSGTPGRADFQSMEFERYRMRVATQVPVLGDVKVGGLSTPALLALPPNPYTRAELQYRMTAPIMCVVLMLLAIPLGFVNPRAGASTNLILALLVFFTYLNLTKAAEKAVEQGRLAFAMGWWPLHLLLLVVALVLFAWRMNVNHRLHPMVVLNALRRRRLLQSASVKGGAQ